MAVASVLLFSLQSHHWTVCRLAAALGEAGWRVATVAPAGSALHGAVRADRKTALGTARFAPAIRRALERAAAESAPALLVPADDLACAFVAHLMTRPGRLSPRLRDLIAASLGDTATLYDRLLKHRTLARARAAGLPVPPGRTVADAGDAAAFAEANGYPVILKQAWNTGGNGVRKCDEGAALASAFRELATDPPLRWAILRRLLGRAWRPSRQPVDVQAFIAGTPAMSCAVARDGKVVAVLCALVRQTVRPHGPSSVVTLRRHAGMEAATAAMTAAFGASGFISLDFVIEADTGRAILIECNPRPIQIAPLGARIGVDLIGALGHAFAGAARPARPGAAEETVALFPQEWLRDRASPYLATAFHDVPWDEPALIKAMLGRCPAPVRNERGR